MVAKELIDETLLGEDLLQEQAKYLPTQYQQFIHKSRYARWDYQLARRETWPETVNRYIQHFTDQFQIEDNDLTKIKSAILNLQVMPSMRAIMTAGEALSNENIAGYNCAYAAVDSPEYFAETFYILMCGTGMGYSVERQFVSKMPKLYPMLNECSETIIVPDSRIGWAQSLNKLIFMLYEGLIPHWDISLVRERGAPLKTFGGRASGGQVLVDLFRFVINTFRSYYKSDGKLDHRGDRLESVSVHDILCKIADVTIAGGVRRSALLSLSNLSDNRMARAKTGEWWNTEPQRALANNSVCYTERPDFEAFMDEWTRLYKSKCGERGMFNREAARKKFEEIGRSWVLNDVGCNPCSEILLRGTGQMCNLSEVIIRKEDGLKDLLYKVEIATIIGTLQASQTKFKFLRRQWAQNCKDEALLGVSLTGIMDHPILANVRDPKAAIWLSQMRLKSKEINRDWSNRIGINPSTAITTVKPSGTVSQLVDSASGIHPRYSTHYIRTVRGSNNDPITRFMSDKGVPCEPDVTNNTGTVFSFPIKSNGTVFRDDMGAIEQLEHWKLFNDIWCDHKPSITVYYKANEFLAVGQWVWDNFDDISGISFLPHTDHVYAQAPYQEITEMQYETLVSQIPSINWNGLIEYEKDDMTTAAKELACSSGGACELP